MYSRLCSEHATLANEKTEALPPLLRARFGAWRLVVLSLITALNGFSKKFVHFQPKLENLYIHFKLFCRTV